MDKKIHLALIAMIGCALAQAKVICFDLHGVIIDTSGKDIVETLREAPARNYWATIPVFFNPYFYKNLYEARKLSKVAEVRFDYLAKHHPALELNRTQFYELSNGHLMSGMLGLLEELKAQGHTLYIASNSGEESLKHILEVRFPALKPLFAGTLVPNTANGFIAKPDPVYFKQLRAKVTQEQGTAAEIIFVDNDSKNVASARSVFIGADETVCFISADQLRSYFVSRGYLQA